LRFRRADDGLVVYSIGPNSDYDGKGLDDPDQLTPPAVRVEFRLWDPSHRRQAPRRADGDGER